MRPPHPEDGGITEAHPHQTPGGTPRAKTMTDPDTMELRWRYGGGLALSMHAVLMLSLPSPGRTSFQRDKRKSVPHRDEHMGALAHESTSSPPTRAKKRP